MKTPGRIGFDPAGGVFWKEGTYSYFLRGA